MGHLLNALSIMGHTHQHLTAFRKDAQRYALPYDYKGVCDVEAGNSKLLYGEDGAVVGAVVGEATSMWLAIGSYNYGIPAKRMPFPNGTCTADLVNGSMTTVAMTTALTTSATTFTTGMMPEESPISPGLQWLYSISYLWYTGIGMIIVVVVGLPVSFLTGANSTHDIPAKYQIPVFSRIFCCLPNSWLRGLACNRDFPNPEDIRADEKDEEIIIDAPEKKKVPEDFTKKFGHDNISFDPKL
ncbi:sodium-dependent multivitamin transporter, partial [Aplysia californica]|uniref:Sodium-dependent multivitamin transporter n=1 Tax=Aplysia californica TaxID=6500 RepID=A0ABM1VWV4_APLCA